jgi:multiple sugar transport system permease protein
VSLPLLTFASIVAGVFILLPLLWIVVTAFQSPAKAFSIPPDFLFRPTFVNFSALYQGQNGVVVPYIQDIGHSAIVLVVSGAIALILGVPAGYALARSHFRGKRAVTIGLVATYITPSALYIIPLYFIYNRIHIIFTYPGLILFNETFELPLAIFFMRSFFADISPQYDEAARVDGCTRWQAFRQVVLPMAKPGLVVVAMLVAIGSWGEYFGATILTTTTIQTAPVAIQTYISYGTTNWSVLAAATFVLVVPVLVLTTFLLRGFTARFVRA